MLAEPKLAKAVADTLSTVALTTAGGRQVSGALALPNAKLAWQRSLEFYQKHLRG